MCCLPRFTLKMRAFTCHAAATAAKKSFCIFLFFRVHQICCCCVRSCFIFMLLLKSLHNFLSPASTKSSAAVKRRREGERSLRKRERITVRHFHNFCISCWQFVAGLRCPDVRVPYTHSHTHSHTHVWCGVHVTGAFNALPKKLFSFSLLLLVLLLLCFCISFLVDKQNVFHVETPATQRHATPPAFAAMGAHICLYILSSQSVNRFVVATPAAAKKKM